MVKDALDRRGTAREEREIRTTVEGRVAGQTGELEARLQELTALNRAFQAELSRRFSAEKAASLGMGASREERFRRSPTVLLEAERERISVYLEDQVRSRLLVLQYSLDRCRELVHHDPSSALSLLDGSKADLRSVQEDHVRRISQELYPESTEGMTLQQRKGR